MHLHITRTILSVALISGPLAAFVPTTTKIHLVKVPITSLMNQNDDVSDFDPLLSPHAYPNGIDNGTVSKSDEKSSSVTSFGFGSFDYKESVTDRSTVTCYEDFDPTLSPHNYPNGVDAGVVDGTSGTSKRRQGKLGILLIDHGSKRQASNEHLHNLAKIYQHNYNENNVGEEATVVRGAHMEIADPSILTSLRDLVTVDQVTRIVCVPYFLSPGRHATKDVPNLIKEAKSVLNEEGIMNLNAGEKIEIIVSDALGTHTESMLGAVDKLVDLALDKQAV